MQFIRRYRWAIIGVGTAAVVVAFLAFRPDTLFIDDVVDESLAEAFVDPARSDIPSTTSIPQVIEDAETPEATSPLERETSAPTVVTGGQFYGIGHAAAGTARIYEQDGAYVLRFEDDTDIQNGPDLYVWVLPSADYDGGTPTGFIDLGKLKGNVGGQNYELPADFDPTADWTVLIWCLRFSVAFAAAPVV